MRAIAQSLAREFGPKGVHVSHIVVDGVIDIPRTHGWEVNGGVADGKLAPDGVSDTFPSDTVFLNGMNPDTFIDC